MKVNVTGKGFIPGFGSLAPVYNKEADKATVKKLLAFRNFRVYRSEDPVRITMKNIDEVFANKPAAAVNKNTVTEPVVSPTATHAPIAPVVETKKVEAAPVVEEVKEEVVEEVVEEVAPVVEDEVISAEAVTEETADVVDEVVDEVTDEEVVESITDLLVDEVKEEVTTDETTEEEKTAATTYSKKKKRHH